MKNGIEKLKLIKFYSREINIDWMTAVTCLYPFGNLFEKLTKKVPKVHTKQKNLKLTLILGIILIVFIQNLKL